MIHSSYSENTIKRYRKSCADFSAFLTSINSHLHLPASPESVLLFVTHLHKKGYRPATVRTYLSAISFTHKINGFQDPTCAFIIKRALVGMSKSSSKIPKLLPITSEILQRMINAIHLVTRSSYTHSMLSALFAFTYHACLRAGEVVLSTNKENILLYNQLKKIEISGVEVYELCFKKYKHSHPNNSSPKLLIYPSNSPYCTLKLLQHYLNMRGTADGPLFMDERSSPLKRKNFSRYVKLTVERIGLPSSSYNTHSFRIGRSTDLKLQGIDDDIIKRTGRW